MKYLSLKSTLVCTGILQLRVKKALQMNRLPQTANFLAYIKELFLFNSELPQQCPHGTFSYELPVLAGNVELTPGLAKLHHPLMHR